MDLTTSQIIGIVVGCIGLGFLALWWQFRRLRKVRREGQFFQSSHGEIFYTLTGKGPTVFLIHGIGSSTFCWRLITPLLEKHFQIVAIDLWGFGRSHKDPYKKMTLDHHCEILVDLMDDLLMDKVHLIGCSMGGAIGLWFARQHPGRVEKIVTLAPAAHPSLVPPYIKRMKWIAGVTPLLINKVLIKRALTQVYSKQSLVTTEAVEEYFRPYLDWKAHKTFAAALDLIEDPRIFDNLPSIHHDMLTLWGESDLQVPKTVMQNIVRNMANTQFQVHPEGGHHLMEEYPDWCADKIIPFLGPK